MPKQKTHRASAKRFKRTGSVDLNVSVLTLLTVSTEKLRNNVVIFVKHLWCIQEISNVSKQCLLA